MDAKTKKKFLFDAHKIPAERFELPNDGRKAKHKAACRRTLYLELGSFGDASGRGACPSGKTLAKRIGWCERTIDNFLADLKTLGFIQNRQKSRFGGSMIRDLVLSPMAQDSQPPIAQDSLSMAQDSQPMAHPNCAPMAHPNCALSASYLPTKTPAYQPPENGGDGLASPENPTGKEKFHKADKPIDYEKVFSWFEGETRITLSEGTRTKLQSQFGDASCAALRNAFRNLANRDMGWEGFKHPAAIPATILKEFPACLQKALRDIERDIERDKQKADIAYSNRIDMEQRLKKLAKLELGKNAEDDAIEQRTKELIAERIRENPDYLRV